LIKEEDKSQTAFEIIQYFNQKIKNKTLTKEDEFLFKVLDPEIISLFELCEKES